MKISELPIGVREKALKYQREDKRYSKKSDYLGEAFSWTDTKEGLLYWIDWEHEEYSPIQDVATLRLQTPDNDEFCRKIDELIKNS